ncbi:unnamed protein product [Adineta ricciae]|uniref:Uncharacterized protein n=1 Tax=Adineta ricciae TaxID=249248 RepID=A0A815V7B8_ADIRI|nr:unnamed protein product [Adineta ricciae]CAF1533773.1 unnamed protein product [Adineta ricciae]
MFRFLSVICLVVSINFNVDSQFAKAESNFGCSCKQNPTCYSDLAGIYYPTLSITPVTYVIMTLRSDSSYTWTGSDQQDNPLQPYSASHGKWECQENHDVQLIDYDFGYLASVSPGVVTVTTWSLSLKNARSITGTFIFRNYNMNTTYLADAVKSHHRHLDHDHTFTSTLLSVSGYQIRSF